MSMPPIDDAKNFMHYFMEDNIIGSSFIPSIDPFSDHVEI